MSAAPELLATTPEVIARAPDGSTEHVAEARAGTGTWIAAAAAVARVLLNRTP
jgi:hypothetical protein